MAVLLIAAFGLAAAEEGLPDAKEILERSIEKMGGREAFQKINTRVVKATVEITPAGIKAKTTTYQSRPNSMVSNMEIEGIGNVSQGSRPETGQKCPRFANDFEVFWAESREETS